MWVHLRDRVFNVSIMTPQSFITAEDLYGFIFVQIYCPLEWEGADMT